MSGNKCAMPDCKSPLVIENVVVGEICHIRARRKGGPRYDPAITQSQRDEFENLILLCSTCHKLIDSNPSEYSVEWLRNIKWVQEQKAQLPLELSITDVRNALMLLKQHMAGKQKLKTNVEHVAVYGGAQSTAERGGVAVAIGGVNHAPINIRMATSKSSRIPYPGNSIGADANMMNYVEYLCERYVKYMLPAEPDEKVSWAKIGRQIKTKFRLGNKTRGHLPAHRFGDLVNFLIREKLARTPVGMKHLRSGNKMCRTFDEYRHGAM